VYRDDGKSGEQVSRTTTKRDSRMETEAESVDIAARSQKPPPETDFIVHATTGRRLSELAFGAAMAVESLLWLSLPPQVPTYPWLFVPFFALLSIHFLLRALDPRPRLAVDADGITDRTALILGPLRIAWEDVVDISTPQLTGSVEIAVRELGEIKRRVGPVRRLWMSLRRLAGTTTISIKPTFLGLKRHELESCLKTALNEFEHAQITRTREHVRNIDSGQTAQREPADPQQGTEHT
jgi:hypothetical protein